jgi:hypothetical protein
MSDSTKSLSPVEFAHQLFNAALLQCKGNAQEASLQVMGFLTEALVFSVSMSIGDNEIARKGLLKHIGETIAKAPPHPLAKVPRSGP